MKMSSLSTHALNRLIVINRSLFSLGTSSISLRVNHAGIAVGSEETKIKAVRNQPRVYLLNQHKEPSIGFEEAMAALRAYSLRELPETVEIVLKCNMKYKKDKLRQPFRGSFVFPHNFGRQQRVLIFAENALAQEAYNAGADIVGGVELIEKVSKGFKGFDICLCTPLLLDKVKKLQSVLRAKMPTTRRGTVVEEFEEPIRRLKNSREYHSDKRGYIVSPVGKLEFPDEKILNNIRALTGAVVKHRETNPIKTFIESATLSSTYGPGFLVNVNELLDHT